MAVSSIPEYGHLVPTSASKSVTTAGTRVQLSTDSSIRSGYIVIQALSTNSGKIFLGGTTVSSSNGLTLSASASVTLNAEAIKGGARIYRLSDFYIDSSVNGEGVNITYFLEATS